MRTVCPARTRIQFLLIAVLFGTVGCSSSGTVSGKITYQNSPVKGGTIIFVTADGSQFSGPINEDGTYKVEKVPKGDVKIIVETSSLAQRATQKLNAPPEGQQVPGAKSDKQQFDPAEAQRRYTPIPGNYERADSTPLKLAVKGGAQTHDITLEGVPSQPNQGGPAGKDAYKSGSKGGPPK